MFFWGRMTHQMPSWTLLQHVTPSSASVDYNGHEAINSQISFKKEQFEVACQWVIPGVSLIWWELAYPWECPSKEDPPLMTDVGRGDPFPPWRNLLLAWTSIQLSCTMPATLCFRLWFPTIDFSWSSIDFLHYCTFLWLAMWWCNKWYFFI